MIHQAACKGIECGRTLEPTTKAAALEYIRAHRKDMAKCYKSELQSSYHHAQPSGEQMHARIRPHLTTVLGNGMRRALWVKFKQEHYPDPQARTRAEFEGVARELIRRVEANPRKNVKWVIGMSNDVHTLPGPGEYQGMAIAAAVRYIRQFHPQTLHGVGEDLEYTRGLESEQSTSGGPNSGSSLHRSNSGASVSS